LLGPRQGPIYATLREYGIDRPRLEACRALAKDKAGQNEAAKELYLELARQKSQEPSVYLGLKDIYLNERQKGKALRILEQGRQIAPSSMEIALAYAEVLADTNRSSEGRAIAQSLASQYPTEAAPMVTLGLIEEKRKNPEMAEAYYEDATTRDPSDFMANFRVGKFYYSMAEDGKAKHASAQAIKNFQEKSLHFAEIAALANPKHFANSRILLSLYTDLCLTEKAQLLRTELN
jgi:predicted Zn-dependent protease